MSRARALAQTLNEGFREAVAGVLGGGNFAASSTSGTRISIYHE